MAAREASPLAPDTRVVLEPFERTFAVSTGYDVADYHPLLRAAAPPLNRSLRIPPSARRGACRPQAHARRRR